VICPANLRNQWSQELADKFYLPSVILETRTFNEAVKRGNLNPFQQDAVVICSFQFARSKEPYVRQSGWELIVIDEAHRLRNVPTCNPNSASAATKTIITIKTRVSRCITIRIDSPPAPWACVCFTAW
jgi:SNF2 family DNA or RNA helicase